MTEKDIIIQDLRRENAELRAKLAKDTNVHTNADRIRSMSDEELAKFMDICEMGDIDYSKTFCDLCNGQYECNQCRLDWLRQPAEEG